MGRDLVTVESQEQAAERLTAAISQICGRLNAAHAELVGLVGEAVEREVHTDCTASQWLGWLTGSASGRVQQWLRVARAQQTHPAICAAFNDGLLSIDQAALAVGVHESLDEIFARLAASATIPQLKVLVRAARRARPTGEPGVPEARPLSIGFDDDGRLNLDGSLDVDDSRVVHDALREARDMLFHAGNRGAGWDDALVEMAHRSLDTVTSPVRRDHFRSYVFIRPGEVAPYRFIDGIPLPDWFAHQIMCDGTFNPVYLDGALPVSVGTTQSEVPERTRRLVLARDSKCRVPWCAQQQHLQIHHVVHQEHGGGHDTDNLAGICPRHHRQHHKGDLGISGHADDPDGLTFTNRHGRPIDCRAHPVVPTGPPPPAEPFPPPPGDRMQRWAVDFTGP